MKKNHRKKIKIERRRLLKLMLIGGGVVVVGKALSLFWDWRKGSKGGFEIGEDFGEDFKVVKKKDQLIFYNKKGEKVLTLSQDGELEVGE